MTSLSLNAETLAVKAVGVEEFDNTYTDDAQYGHVQFWDNRYLSDPEPFEWYYGYEYFQAIVNEAIPKKNKKVMIAGCGTSYFIDDMVADGFTDILGVDISRVAIEIMKARCQDMAGVTFLQGTMVDTDLPEKSFKAIIDKACFDSIICNGVGMISIRQYLFEIDRLLEEDGVFIVISHGNPEQRLVYLEQYDTDLPGFTPWLVEVLAMRKPEAYDDEKLEEDDPASYYFIYICKKDRALLSKLDKKRSRDAKNSRKKADRTRRAPPL